MGVNKTIVSYYFHRLREIIAFNLYQEAAEVFSGKIEVDESYFSEYGKGKRGRGAAGKVTVFGLLKRSGKVYTEIIPYAKTETLMLIMQNKIMSDSIIYSDSLASYNVLDISEFKHHRIDNPRLFADKHNHINGIENFWNQA